MRPPPTIADKLRWNSNIHGRCLNPRYSYSWSCWIYHVRPKDGPSRACSHEDMSECLRTGAQGSLSEVANRDEDGRAGWYGLRRRIVSAAASWPVKHDGREDARRGEQMERNVKVENDRRSPLKYSCYIPCRARHLRSGDARKSSLQQQ